MVTAILISHTAVKYWVIDALETSRSPLSFVYDKNPIKIYALMQLSTASCLPLQKIAHFSQCDFLLDVVRLLQVTSEINVAVTSSLDVLPDTKNYFG